MEPHFLIYVVFLFLASLEQTQQWIEDIENSPNHKMYLANLCGVVCGWIVVEKRIFLGAGHKGEITAVVVSAEYRKHGVGRALLIAAEKWAQSKALRHLVVRSNLNRTESHDFYLNTGFGYTKTAHNYQKAL